MRAAAIDRFGDPDELTVHALDDPLLPPDGLLVRVHAAGVNPVDTKIRQGALAERFPCFFPLIPGWDLSGVVEQVGPSVTGFAPGDRVCAYARKDHIRDGTYAELTTVRYYHAAQAGTLGHAAAGGLPLAGLTAYQALHERLAVSGGDVVAVRGASGGVGSMAVQLAKAAGARVLGIAGSGSEDRVRELGADAFAAHDAGDLTGALSEVTRFLDLVGPDGLDELVAALPPDAHVCTILDPTPPASIGDRRWSYEFVRPDGELLSRLVALCDEGALRVDAVEEFALADAGRAHERLEGGGVHGKLVIAPQG